MPPNGQDDQAEAERELHTLLDNPESRSCLGFIIVSGAGLSARDLEELTGRPADDIAAQIGALVGVLTLISRDGGHAYQIADPGLNETARQSFSQDSEEELADYREHIHRWYQRYQAAGWPQGTPGYLLWHYPEQLRAGGDVGRLPIVATDSARHDRMLELGRSDMPGLEEVHAALPLLADQPDPDLTMVAQLVLERERLASRNHAMPENLPAVWIRLGQTHRARGLARSIPDVLDRVKALTMLAAAVPDADPALAALALQDAEAAASAAPWRDRDRAENARKRIRQTRTAMAQHKDMIWGYPEPKWQWADTSRFSGPDIVRLQHRLTALAAAVNTLSRDDADGLDAIMSPPDHIRALVARAEVLTSLGSSQAAHFITAAEQALGSASGPTEQVKMLVTSTGSPTSADTSQATQSAEVLRDHAAELTRTITMPLLRATVLTAQASAEASIAPVHAAALVGKAGEIIRHAREPDGYNAVALATMAVLLATSLPDQAQNLAQQAEEDADATPRQEVRAVAQACVAAILAGTHKDQAARLARKARDCAKAINDPEPDKYPTPVLRPVICASVAAVLATSEPDLASDLADEAARSAQAIARPSTRAQVLADVADAFCDCDAFRERVEALAMDAEEAARRVRECGFRAPVLGRMVWALSLADAGATPRESAEQDWENTNIGHEGSAFEAIAAGLALAREWDAAECAARAADIALQVFKGAAQSKVAAGMAAAGLYDRAEGIAESLGRFRSRVLASIASALASTDAAHAAVKARAAVQVTRYYSDSWAKPIVFLDTALALAGTFPDQASDLADEIYHDITADEAEHAFDKYASEYLARIARVLALAGRWDHAHNVAQGIKGLKDRADAFADIAIGAIAAKQFDRATIAIKAIPADHFGLRARVEATLAGTAANIIPELSADHASIAERLARASMNPALMLINTAEALHDSLTPEMADQDHALHQQARHMLGLALSLEGSEWISAMPVLGKLAPEAVKAFYDRLLTLGTPKQLIAVDDVDPINNEARADGEARGPLAQPVGAGEIEEQLTTSEHRSTGIMREYDTDWTATLVKIYCSCGTVCQAAPTSNYPNGVGALLLAWRQFREHALESLGPADGGTCLYAAGLIDELERQRDRWSDHGLALLAALEISFAEMQGNILS